MMLDTVALLGKFSVADLGLRDLRDGSGEATEGARELGFEQCTGSHCRARRKNRETYMPLLDGVFLTGCCATSSPKIGFCQTSGSHEKKLL